MKKLTILFVFVIFAFVGCADNMDTVPQPVTPQVNVNIDNVQSTTPEEEEDTTAKGPRRPKNH